MEAVPPFLLHEASSLAGLVVMVMMGYGVRCVQVLIPSGAAEVQSGFPSLITCLETQVWGSAVSCLWDFFYRHMYVSRLNNIRCFWQWLR